MLDTYGDSSTARRNPSGEDARQVAPSERGAEDTGAAARGGPLDKAIQRLADILDEETAALKSHRVVDLREFNNRKSQGLLEFSHVLRHSESVVSDQDVRGRLAGLRAKLLINQAVLKMHLDAVREISSVVTEAFRDAESDGTYSPSIRGTGTQP